MSAERHEDLVLAGYEAMSNFVEHAYRDQPRPGVLEVNGERRRVTGRSSGRPRR